MDDTGVQNLDLGLAFHHNVLGGSRLKRSTEDASVKMARNRFKNVLKHLVQESFLPEDETDSDDDQLGLPPNKRRKSSNGEPLKQQPTFVMKLFDRGVDLAQFDDTTPLYPICRAWIQNKPHAVRPPRSEADEEDEPDEMDWKEETEDVYRLPPPEALPYDEYGLQISLRCPPHLPSMDEPFADFDINYSDESAPSPALLFQNHLDRWNLIRQRWKEASAYNEGRYMESFGILRNIYDKNRPEDTTRAAVVAASAAAAAAAANVQVIEPEKIEEQQEHDDLFIG